jgi:RimJ/RimL family protein N-acetyltransferase
VSSRCPTRAARTAMAKPTVSLEPIDEPALERLLTIAVADAAPEEVMPPVPGHAGWTPARIDAFRAYHRACRGGLDGPRGEVTFLVHADGRPVGAARLERAEQDALEVGVWLRRSARGRGLGRQILDAVLEEAAAFGARRIIAETTAENRAALSVLRRAGARIDASGPDGKVRAELLAN